MERRTFFKRTLGFSALAVASKAMAWGDKNSDDVKFSVFSDLHYRDGNYNKTIERLQQILSRAKENDVDFIMHCGDFCHNVRTAKPVLNPYNSFGIPTYHTMGNHDFESTKTLEEVVSAYKMERNYYSFDVKGFRFISLDTNYFTSSDGKFVHYASSSAYEKCHQKEAIITPEQIKFLKDRISTASGPCVIFSHHGFYLKHGITNAVEVKKTLFENQCTPIMWINGHYHRNSLKLINQVAFFNLNSTTSVWLGKTHNAYPPEIMNSSPLANHELLYEKPVHAIVSIKKDGTFTIDGMEGSMYLGVTLESTGNKNDDFEGLPCDASVLSSKFKLYPPKRD